MKVNSQNYFNNTVNSNNLKDSLIAGNIYLKLIQSKFDQIINSGESFETKVESLKNTLPLSARVTLLNRYTSLEKMQKNSMENFNGRCIPLISPDQSEAILKHYQNAICLLKTSL